MGYEFTPEQIATGNVYTGDKTKDLDIANSILTGQYSVIDQPVVEPPVGDTPVSDTPIGVDETTVVTDPNGEVTQAAVDLEEAENQRRYEEFQRQIELENEIKRKEHESLLKLKEKEDLLNKEKQAREDLERRLQELTELQQLKLQQTSTSNGSTDDNEDDLYVSEYTKQIKRTVDELKETFGKDNAELKEKLAQFEEQNRVVLEEKRKREAEELEKKSRDKTFNTIRDFQKKYSELSTSKDIEEVEKEYLRFRSDMAALTKAKNAYELEKAINDYMSGGDYKKIADSRGIKMPDEYSKYQEISELYRMKHGLKYDPVTGQDVPILNDEGVQVRYSSLEEAYKVKNIDRLIEDARKRSFKEVAQKLTTVNNSARELPSDNVGSISVPGITPEMEAEVMNWNPKYFINDPQKREIFRKVYLSRGMTPPSYRGQQI